MHKAVSESELFARINQALAKGGQSLCRAEASSQWHSNLGSYYIVDYHTEGINASHCDLEKLGKETGVLQEGEVLVGTDNTHQPR